MFTHVILGADDVEASRRLIETLLARQKDGPAREELRRLIALDSAAGTETLTWARRTLAVRNASTGDYRDFLEAIGLRSTRPKSVAQFTRASTATR